MKIVGIKKLKNKLSEYVRMVASGETVLISHGDDIVAELIPPRSGRSLDVADARLADLIREGILTPSLQSRGPPPASPNEKQSLKSILEELDVDRADR